MTADNEKKAEYMTALFVASAIATLTVTAPDIPIGSRLPFVLRVLKSGDKGIVKGHWEFTAGSSIFASFSAKRK